MPPTARHRTTALEIVLPRIGRTTLGRDRLAHPRLDRPARRFLKGRDPDAYVASNMFLDEDGNPKANRSPDCMVCLGVVGQSYQRGRSRHG